MPRKNAKPVTTYRMQDIMNWKQTLDGIPFQVEISNARINENKLKFDAETNALAQLTEKEINPTLETISKIQAQLDVVELPKKINVLEQKIKDRDSQLVKLKAELDTTMAIIHPIEQEIDVITKRILLAGKQIELKQLNVSLSQEETELENENLTLSRLQMTLSESQSKRSKLQNKLSQLMTERQRRQVSDNNGYTSSQQSQSAVVYNNAQSNNGYETSQNQSQSSSPITTAQEQIRLQQEAEIVNLQSEIQNLKLAINTLELQQKKSQSNITSKQSAISRLKLDIQRYEYHCKELQYEIGPDTNYTSTTIGLRIELDRKTLQKKPHEEERISLEEQIKDCNQGLAILKNSLQKSQCALDAANELIKYLPKQNDLESLRNELVSHEQHKADLLKQQSYYDNQLAAIKKEIQSEKRQLESLTEKRKELSSNEFISQLLAQPYELLLDLVERTKAYLTTYELKHPAGQSSLTRRVLADIEIKMQLIQSEQPPVTLYPNDIKNNVDRVRYLQLCGLLWAMYDKAVDEDKELAECLLSSLGDKTLNPDEAKQEYFVFRDVNPTHAEMTEDGECVNSRQNYLAASDAIKRTILALEESYNKNGKDKKVRDFIDQGKKVWNLIESNVEDASQIGQTDFDLKFHINLLNKTNLVLQNPRDPKLNREYRELAAHTKDGKPSLCKKLSGAMLMFAGVALTVGSALAFVFGIPDPFEKPMIFGGILAGIGLFSSGLALFRSGMKKDLALETERFSNSATRAGLTFWQTPAVKETSVPAQQPEAQKESKQEDLQYGDYLNYLPSAP